jgi:uncharacterized protein (DUF2252 family)
MLKRNDQSRDRRSDRLLRLLRRRDLKMARSPHAFVRGATQNFYDWLDKSPGKMPEGPPVWICGDCHAGNLGPIADAEGWVAVQIQDLDQTAIANPAYDSSALACRLPRQLVAQIYPALPP